MQTPLPGRPPPRLAGGRFLIIDTLGDGGTATVYLTWDDRERQWCALKAIHRSLLRDEEMCRRFGQEADALGRFSHPNIPRLIFQDCEGTPPFMVMELARSGSVMDWVKENGPMPPTLAADVLYQVCQALDAAHAQGVIHRDVKPHNFLIDDDGVCKLTDFGIARWGDEASMTATGSQIGTFSFMAPEQRSDTKSVDERADVYSLGASLYTMMTGRTSAELFVAETDDALLADVPDAYRSVILKATQYRADERYSTALEFQEALMEALARISPASAMNLPSLTRELAPLPRRPPEMLPEDTEFPELDWLFQTDPPPAPAPARVQEHDHEMTERTGPEVLQSLGYRMPSRSQPRMARMPMEAGYLVSEDGATYLPDTDEITQNIAAQVRAEVERSLRRPEDEGLVGVGGLATALLALTGAVIALVVLLVLGGAGWVWWHELGHDEAARELHGVLHENGAVVYDLARDRTAIQAAFDAYESLEGPEQLAAATAFVDAVVDAAAHSERLEPSTTKRLNRLRSARDTYQETLVAWDGAARRFPGSVAVRLSLASVPPVASIDR